MSNYILLSPEITLPIDIVTMRAAIYGTSGAGKTTFCRLLAERVHSAGQRFCAIDLKNDWWGLKSSADGKSEGLPIVIFGGPRKDVQIFDDAGAATADTIATIEQSCIIDLDEFSRNKQLKFITAFLERLYDVNRKPLLLFADESDRYAPQKPMSDQMNFSLGASEDICRRGRKRGIGSFWNTQRTAVLNKNVSDICDLTVVFRTPGSRDLKDLEERVGRVANKEQVAAVMKQAPGLEDGQAIFLSSHPKLRAYMPENAHPVQMPLPWTFDSSATPRVGQRKVEPKVLSQVDLAAIEERMAAQVERAKQDDPKELRAEIARLKRELAKVPNEKPVETKRVEVPVLKDGQMKRVEGCVERLVNVLQDARGELAKQIEDALFKFAPINEALVRLKQPAPNTSFLKTRDGAGTVVAAPGTHHLPAREVRTQVPRQNGSGATGAPVEDGAISGVMQRILDALAELEQLGANQPARELVAFMANYTNLRSKGFSNAIGSLRTSGLIDYPNSGSIMLTESGRAAASYRTAPRTAEEVQTRICTLLGGASSRILQPLINSYPNELSREDVAAAAGYGNLRSKGFANAIGRLRSLGFVDYPSQGTIKANPVLFLEGVS